MSGNDSAPKSGSPPSAADPDSLEVVSGADHERLEGWVPDLASPDELRIALERAFDYRGNVLLSLKNGTKVEGYVFDRRAGTSLEDSSVRLMAKDGGKQSIRYADIAALAFTGRDMAAGKNWENWVRSYWKRKGAGETNISLQPEKLE